MIRTVFGCDEIGVAGPEMRTLNRSREPHYWVRYGLDGSWSIDHEADPQKRYVWATSASIMFEMSRTVPKSAHGASPAASADLIVPFFGVGLEYWRFFREAFKPFGKTSLKIRPLAVRINKPL